MPETGLAQTGVENKYAGDGNLEAAFQRLAEAIPSLDDEAQAALVRVIEAARESEAQQQGEINAELKRRDLEMTTGVSGTENGKLAVEFLSQLSTDRLARLIDDGTITQGQVDIFAALKKRQAEAFS